VKWDMHIHTKYSPDSTTEITDILAAAKRAGMDGIAVTDHDTIKGGVEAAKLAKDVEVRVGCEVGCEEGDVLGYDLTEEVKSTRFLDAIDEIKGQGGTVAVPHPFDFIRGAAVNNTKLILEAKAKISYLEVNGRSFPFINNKARKLSAKSGIPLIGGSDAHYAWEVGGTHTIFNEDGSTSIKGGDSYMVLVPLVKTKIFKVAKSVFGK